MRILFFDQFAGLGGGQLCLLDVLPAAKEQGWEVHVAAPADGPLLDRVRNLDIPSHLLNLSNYSHGAKHLRDVTRFVLDLPAAAARIAELVKTLDVSLVYVNGPRLMPAVALSRIQPPVIFHSHNRLSRTAAGLVRRSISATRATTIAASRYLAAQWHQASVIYAGVAACAGCDTGLPKNGRCIGMVGRIAPQKKQWEFVVAAHRIAEQLPGARFVLCGDSTLGDPRSESYKARVLAEAPADLKYVGWSDDLCRVLSEIDLLVVPSEDEGGPPRVMLEAFAAGVPVLARNSGAIAEIIVDGSNGFLLEASNADGIADGVLRASEKSHRWADIAANARRVWSQQFTVERYQRDILNVIANCAFSEPR
jgi:glycosyltransferase involved in cell wall biosynthesis